MWEDDLLTLEQAAQLTGRAKRALRELAQSGRLPAVRRKGQWLFARADLRAVGYGHSADEARNGQAAPMPPVREEMMALLELLRQRDAQIGALQDERMRLAGQVGFLQGQLLEREQRLSLLQAAGINQPDALAMARPEERTTQSLAAKSVQSADSPNDTAPANRSESATVDSTSVEPVQLRNVSEIVATSTGGVHFPSTDPPGAEPAALNILETMHSVREQSSGDATESRSGTNSRSAEGHSEEAAAATIVNAGHDEEITLAASDVGRRRPRAIISVLRFLRLRG